MMGTNAVGLGDKFIWVAVVAGIASILVVVAVKVGEAIVRRKTEALLAAHGDSGDEEPEPDRTEQSDSPS